MQAILTQGLSSQTQEAILTGGLSSGATSTPSIPLLVDPYPATYEGLVNIIKDRLISTTTPQYRPYWDTWEGVVNAMKDSVGTGVLRGRGYPKTYQGFIEVVWDKYLTPSELEVRHKYPCTFEGCVQVLIDALAPDYSHAPYLDSFQGMIDVIRDSTI